MSLRENERMVNINPKNAKKSSAAIDIFLVIAVFILIASPFVINFCIKTIAELKRIDVFISSQCEDLFGEEMAELLLQEFGQQNPHLRLHLVSVHDETTPDIIFFDDAGRALIAQETPVITLVSFFDLLFYNIDLLSAAGFDRPPKTREDFLSYARTVSGSDDPRLENVFGAALSLSAKDSHAVSRDIFSWIWAAGGDFFEDEDRPSFNARTMTNFISFLGSLYSAEAFAPAIFDTTGDQRLEEFAQGKIAMMIASSRAIPFLRERMGDSAFGITAIPVPSAGSGGKYGISLSGIYAGISAACAHPEEALSFLAFLEEKSPIFCELLKAVPGAASDIIPFSYIITDPFYSKAWDIYESAGIVHGFDSLTSVDSFNAREYETIFIEELRLFFDNSQTAQQTANAIQQRWDEIAE